MITEQKSVKNKSHSSWNTILDWFYPPGCAGCGRISFLLCDDCLHTFKKGMRTAENVKKNERRYFAGLKAENGVRLLSNIDFLNLHQGVAASLVRALKYHQNQEIGKVLGGLLGEAFLQKAWEIDVVMPVPLGTQRLFERGYNQASLIAYGFSEKTGLPILENGLMRKKETRTQVGLDITQREMNMLEAFMAEKSFVEGKKILLIDDVLTTGATLRSCAVALMEGGATEVSAMTVTSATMADK
jgi:ComF family protein